MTVSKMTAADVPAAAALDRRLFSGECWNEEDFYSSLNDPNRIFFAAHEDAFFVGCCGLQQSCEQGDVLTIAVDPAYRRKGIGSALLQAAVAAFAQQGGTNLFLEVRASNESAKALYCKHGFQQIGVRRGYYQQPKEDGLVYVLEVHA